MRTGDLRYLCLVTVPVHLWGANRVRKWLQDPHNKSLVYCNMSVPFNGFIHMGIAAMLCKHEDACAVISFYYCTWLYGQAANQAFKNIFWRKRPTACLSECAYLVWNPCAYEQQQPTINDKCKPHHTAQYAHVQLTGMPSQMQAGG